MELISPYKWDVVTYKDRGSIPSEYGCYAFIVPWGEVIYIGRSKMLRERLKANAHKILRDLKESVQIAFNTTMYDAEKELIQQYSPILNTAYLK